MIHLNVETAEALVFMDAKLRGQLLPSFADVIDQWLVTQTLPFLRSVRRRCVLDFLDRLTPEHVRVIEAHLGQPVEVEGIDTRIVRNLRAANVEELAQELSKCDGFVNFSLTRDEAGVGATLWR